MVAAPINQSGYIDSYYSRTLNAQDRPYPVLRETLSTESCVIGGGLAGLNVALGLGERGHSVIVLESGRIGGGASGRNGGFVLAGYSAGERDLIKKLGLAAAQELYRLSRDGLELVRSRIKQYDIDCQPVSGHLLASWYDEPGAMQREAEFLHKNFDEKVEYWPRERLRGICRTDRYYDGQFFPDYFHMHPLRYVHGIARAACDQGARIFEASAVLRVEEKPDCKIIHTAQGAVKADHIVYCGSAYSTGGERRLNRAGLKIRSDVMVTEAIAPELLAQAITKPYAIRDSRWADDYYRVLPDNRILWGGGCALGPPPSDLKDRMLAGLLKIYPQLRGIKADIAWSGLMGFTTNKMPVIARLRDGIWACTYAGGQGLNVTTTGGELIAAAIADGDERYQLFAPFRPHYAGGPLGPVAAQALYHSWQLGDFLKGLKRRAR